MTVFEPVTVEDYVVSRDYDGLMEYLISNDSGVPEVSPWYLSMVLWVCKLTTAEVAAGAVTVLVVHDVDVTRSKNELYEAVSAEDYKVALEYAWIAMPQAGPITIPGVHAAAVLLPQHSPLRVSQREPGPAGVAGAVSAAVQTSPLAAPAVVGAAPAAPTTDASDAAGATGGFDPATQGVAAGGAGGTSTLATPPAGLWSSRLRSSSKKSHGHAETIKASAGLVADAVASSSGSAARLFL